MNENHIFQQIEQLVNSGRNREEILLETCRLLQKHFPKYNWVGFYLVNGDELVLGPYVGKPSPHTQIKFGSGICGAAVREGQTVVVNDVNSDPRYLACSLETNSEIVVPIWKQGKIVGEIDIDSDLIAAFDNGDRKLLEQVSHIISRIL